METAEQELEALKDWWKENGRALVVGVTIGLGGVFGWTWWQGHLRTQAEEASQLYQQLMENAATDRHDAVRAQARSIRDSYPKTGYAALAALLAAKSAFEENDLEAAKGQLQWLIDNSDDVSFKDLARLRLARILIQEDRLEEALNAVDAITQQAFEVSANETRGDILVTRGNTQAALEAYGRALTSSAISGPTRSRVQMKLDDLGSNHADNLSG